jgi:hypothetical protein
MLFVLMVLFYLNENSILDTISAMKIDFCKQWKDAICAASYNKTLDSTIKKRI